MINDICNVIWYFIDLNLLYWKIYIYIPTYICIYVYIKLKLKIWANMNNKVLFYVSFVLFKFSSFLLVLSLNNTIFLYLLHTYSIFIFISVIGKKSQSWQ